MGGKDIMKFLDCRQCGEGFIKFDMNTGLGHFKYGKAIKGKESRSNEDKRYNPVDIYIWGTVKMRCFRCGTWNYISFFPKTDFKEE